MLSQRKVSYNLVKSMYLHFSFAVSHFLITTRYNVLFVRGRDGGNLKETFTFLVNMYNKIATLCLSKWENPIV